MIYNKRPLIYIPGKRKRKSETTIIQPTEVLGAVYVTTSWCYSPVYGGPDHGVINPGNFRAPHTISYSPRAINFHVGSKQVSLFNVVRYYSFYPILADSSYNFKQTAEVMRWIPMYPHSLDVYGPGGFVQAFIIQSGVANILKLYDSSYERYPTHPHNITVGDDGDAIVVDSTLSIRKHRIDDSGYLEKVQAALTASGYSANSGILILCWHSSALPDLTDDQILEYSSGLMDSYYGRKTGVIDFDIA